MDLMTFSGLKYTELMALVPEILRSRLKRRKDVNEQILITFQTGRRTMNSVISEFINLPLNDEGRPRQWKE